MSTPERESAIHPFPSDELTYELVRENRGILLSLTESEHRIAQLQVRLKRLKSGRVELIVEIEDAKSEISRLTLKLIDSAEEIAHLSSDLHQLKLDEVQLVASEAYWQSAFLKNGEAQILLDESNYLDCNQAALTLLGVPDVAAFRGLSPAELAPPQQPNGRRSKELALEHFEAAKLNGNLHFDWVYRRFDNGLDVPVKMILSQAGASDASFMVASIREESGWAIDQDDFRNLAYTDPLTLLPNRRLLADRMEQAIARCRRSAKYGGLIFLDLDRFKEVNDVHGHAAGDQLLKEAAKRMKSCVRADDTVSRQGGDEFVVLLNELDDDSDAAHEAALLVAQKIGAVLAEPYVLMQQAGAQEQHEITVSSPASIGLTVIAPRAQEIEDVLLRADAAMYKAKALGRNRIEVDWNLLANDLEASVHHPVSPLQ